MANGNQQLLGLLSPETGQNVQAFGAALGGALPQFRQTQALQQQRGQQLSQERKMALLVDNRGVRRALEAGNVDQASRILQSRIETGPELDADMSDSIALLSQIQSDPQGALSEVVQLDNFAVDAGFLDAFPEEARAGGITREVVVKASEILPNGTVIQSTSEGVRVFDAQGNQLSGNDVVDSIEAGQRLGIRVAGDTAAAKAAADEVKQSIKLSGEMFKQVGPIRQSLLTIGKARQALAEGAETGVIDKFLPDLREASIKLTNLMNQLGLEVISGATFGALSAGELRLALDTALPTGLQPEALDRWLQDKGSAQTKLLQELEGDIITLSSGGTIGDIIRARRSTREPLVGQPQQPQAPVPAITSPTPQAVTVPQVTPEPAATGGIRFLGFE